MNKADILTNSVTAEESSLGELQYWLQYAKHTWSLGAAIIWIPYGLIVTGLKILAIFFTPYMLWHLYKAKWYKSVVVLLTAVVLPFLIFQFIQVENPTFRFLLTTLPFLSLYFYCYTLSYMIREQLTKIKTLKKWEREEMVKKINT